MKIRTLFAAARALFFYFVINFLEAAVDLELLATSFDDLNATSRTRVERASNLNGYKLALGIGHS